MSELPVRQLVTAVTVSEPVKPFFPRSYKPREDGIPLGTVTPHPEAWEKAKELAGGDVYRLRVESETSVLVLNHPRFSNVVPAPKPRRFAP